MEIIIEVASGTIRPSVYTRKHDDAPKMYRALRDEIGPYKDVNTFFLQDEAEFLRLQLEEEIKYSRALLERIAKLTDGNED